MIQPTRRARPTRMLFPCLLAAAAMYLLPLAGLGQSSSAPASQPASGPSNSLGELQARLRQAESAMQTLHDKRLASLKDSPAYRQAKAELQAAETKAAETSKDEDATASLRMFAINNVGRARQKIADLESKWLAEDAGYAAAKTAAANARAELLREQGRVRDGDYARAKQEAASRAAALAAVKTAYYPNGKVKATCDVNSKGERHGVCRIFDETGKIIGEQEWVHDRLVLPKTPNFIATVRKQIIQDAAEAVKAFGTPTNKGAPSAEHLALALARIRTYRFLCDVPYRDVTFDDNYINLCQYGAEMIAKIGHLDHTPPKPDGMDEAFYKIAYKGTSQSNLCMGSSVQSSIDCYMDDSDSSNIDRVGHRRWVLNPRMLKTGLGASGKFSAMYSFDGGRKDTPDYEFVCYPPVGACPLDLFSRKFAWHISFNPAHYAMVDSSVKMNIYPLDENLKRAAAPLPLEYTNVNTGGFGIPGAVIVRPAGNVVHPGAIFEVVVNGLKPRAGHPAEVSYLVRFY